MEWEGSDLCEQMTVGVGGGVIWMRVKGVVCGSRRGDERVRWYTRFGLGLGRWWWL